jgi:hypothetical protein
MLESRRKDGWDEGIPRNTVLLHEIRPDGLSYLVREAGPELTLGATYTNLSRGFRLIVERLDDNVAQIRLWAVGSVRAEFARRGLDPARGFGPIRPRVTSVKAFLGF